MLLRPFNRFVVALLRHFFDTIIAVVQKVLVEKVLFVFLEQDVQVIVFDAAESESTIRGQREVLEVDVLRLESLVELHLAV